MPEHPWQVVLLPGGVMPAGPAYGALLTELGSDVDPRPKELEVYAADSPPPDYSLATEVAGRAGPGRGVTAIPLGSGRARLNRSDGSGSREAR